MHHISICHIVLWDLPFLFGVLPPFYFKGVYNAPRWCSASQFGATSAIRVESSRTRSTAGGTHTCQRREGERSEEGRAGLTRRKERRLRPRRPPICAGQGSPAAPPLDLCRLRLVDAPPLQRFARLRARTSSPPPRRSARSLLGPPNHRSGRRLADSVGREEFMVQWLSLVGTKTRG